MWVGRFAGWLVCLSDKRPQGGWRVSKILDSGVLDATLRRRLLWALAAALTLVPLLATGVSSAQDPLDPADEPPSSWLDDAKEEAAPAPPVKPVLLRPESREVTEERKRLQQPVRGVAVDVGVTEPGATSLDEFLERRPVLFGPTEVSRGRAGEKAGKVEFGSLPVRLRVPDSPDRVRVDVDLEVFDADRVRRLASGGLAFQMRVREETKRGAGRTLPVVGDVGVQLPPPSEEWLDRLGATDSERESRRSADDWQPRDRAKAGGLDDESGWELEIDTAAFGQLGASAHERLGVVFWSDCDPDGTCGNRLDLPSRRVGDLLTATLPTAVVDYLRAGSIGAAGSTGRGLGRFQTSGNGSGFGLDVNAAGPSGDFGATADSSLSSYQVGLFTGHAEASYDFVLPPAVGPVPALGLSYSSGVADGMSTSKNNQASTVGLGWDLSQASISRQLIGCTDPNEVGNSCLPVGLDDGFSISLNGVSSRLVSTDPSNNEYRLERDNGWRVRRYEDDLGAREKDPVAIADWPGGHGYWTVDAQGNLTAYGSAPTYGATSIGTLPGGVTAVDIEADPLGRGFWVLRSDGIVATLQTGSALVATSFGGDTDFVAMAATTDGGGYWAVEADGVIHAAGTAPAWPAGIDPGSSTAVDMTAASATTAWVLAADGGVHAVNGAPTYGSAFKSGETNRVAIASTPNGDGYWILNKTGKIFVSGAAEIYGFTNSTTDAKGRQALRLLDRVVDFTRDQDDPDGLHLIQRKGLVVPIQTDTWTLAAHRDFRATRWEVWAPDGTTYSFGADFEPTSNLWSQFVRTAIVPMSGEGCQNDRCDVAYRWDLDRIEDPSGNAASLFYVADIGYYNSKTASSAVNRGYTRDGVLLRIEYGQVAGSEDAQSPYRVILDYPARTCLDPGCPSDWPDTPIDLDCYPFNTSNCTATNVSFWSGLRLESITTQHQNGSGGWTGIGQWVLSQSWIEPAPDGPLEGDRSEAKMQLDSIIHQSADASLAMPTVQYGYAPLNNRVNHGAGISAMTMPRLATINNEFGGSTVFGYGQTRPFDPTPVTPEEIECGPNPPNGNVRRPCGFFPAWDGHTPTPPGEPCCWVLWNKYNVQSLTEDSLFNDGSPPQVITYSYSDPNYRFAQTFGYTDRDQGVCNNTIDPDDDQPPGHPCNNWHDFRGHQRVIVTDGVGRTTEYEFFTGMKGDSLDTQAPLPLEVLASVSQFNEEWYTGRQALVHRMNDAVPAVRVGETRTQVFQSAPLGIGTWPKSRRVYTNSERIRTWPDDGSGLHASSLTVSYSHDSYGNITQVHRAPSGLPIVTTVYSYIQNETGDGDGIYIVDRPWQVRTFQTSPAGTLLAEEVMSWDDLDSQNVPTKGLLFRHSINTGPSGWAETDYQYNSRGQQTHVTNPLNHTTITAHDPVYGHITSVDPPLHPATTIVSDVRFGLPATTTDANGRTTTLTYDKLGRLTQVDQPYLFDSPSSAQPTAKFGYYPGQADPSLLTAEHLRTIGVSGDYEQSWIYSDGLGRQIQTHTRDPNTAEHRISVSTEYDAVGRPYRTSAPVYAGTDPGMGWFQTTWANLPSYTEIDYEFDDGATTKLMDAGVEVYSSTVAYDGVTETIVDPNDNVTVRTNDSLGRLTRVDEAVGTPDQTTLTYGYDLLDRLHTVLNGAQMTTVDYQGLSPWKTSLTDPNTGQWTYTYNAAGQLIGQSDPGGQDLAFNFDALGRQTAVLNADDNNATLAAWDWDPTLGNPAVPEYGLLGESRSYEDANVVATVTNVAVDQAGRATETAWNIDGAPATYSVGSTYNVDGTTASVAYPGPLGDLSGGETVDYTYNHLGQPKTATSNLGHAYVADHGFTTWGATSSLQQGTGGHYLKNEYQYDPATQRMTQLDTFKDRPNPPGGTIRRLRQKYWYDDVGNVTKIKDVTDSNQYACYEYDPHNRLDRAFTTNLWGCASPNAGTGTEPFDNVWDHDQYGNITIATGDGTPDDGTYQYGDPDHPNAVTGITGGSMAFEYNAEGQMTLRTVSGATQNLVYDPQNRLTAISGAVTADIGHDATGVRVQRTLDGETTYYIGDLYVEVAVPTSGPITTTNHIAFAGRPVAMREAGNGEVTYLATDHQGSIGFAEQDSSGQDAKRRYYPYGLQRTGDNSVSGDRSFTAQIDDTYGLMHYRARQYDPTLGRFIQPDAVVPSPGTQVDLNRYSYVRNNPVVYADPTGHCPAGPCVSTLASAVDADVPTSLPILEGIDDFSDVEFYLREGFANAVYSAEDWWEPVVGEVRPCVGRYACQEAWEYLFATGDVNGARHLAQTYCFVQCAVDDWVDTATLQSFGMALATVGLGVAARPLGTPGPSTGSSGGRGYDPRLYGTSASGRSAIPEGWPGRVADNGRGIVYQRPGAPGNIDSVRIMEPTPRYPNGYARFYNNAPPKGQPIDLQGKPGSNATTHIPLNSDGSVQIPHGWGS